MYKGQRIAVLGAGPMGLAVAYQLIKDGHVPVVFEADDRIGGMAASFDLDGLRIERFYHFHCSSDNGLIQMLQELSLSSKLHWVPTKMGYYFQGKVHDWGNPFALLRFPGLSLYSKFLYGMHVFLSTRRTEWRSLDKMESTSWLKKSVGDEAYEILWRKLFDLKFYDYAQSTSAAWTWSRIRRVGRSRYDIFREKLGYIEGGSETVLYAMAEAIKFAGGELRLSCPIKKVVIKDGNAVTGLETVQGFEPFKKVISTVPLPYLPSILSDLPDEILNAYRQVKNIAIVCVVAKLRKPVTKNFWLNINDDNMDIPGIIEYTNLYPLGSHVVYAPYYMPAEIPEFQNSNQVFIDKTKRYLMRINPKLHEEDFTAIYASRYRYAQPICEPGFLDRLPPVQLPVKGLWAADTSYYYPEDRGMSESFTFGRNMAKMAINDD